MQTSPVRRAPQGAVLGGVCAGLARRWGVDPAVLRVAVVVLSLMAGIGVAIYVGAWLLVPREGSTEFPVRTLVPATRTWPAPAVIGLVVALGVLIVATVGSLSPLGVGPAIGAGFLWYFGFYRTKQERPAVPQRTEGSLSPLLPGRPPGAQPVTDFERAAAAWQARVAAQRRLALDPPPWPATVPATATLPSVAPATAPLIAVASASAPAVPVRRRGRWVLPATLVLTGSSLAILAALDHSQVLAVPAIGYWAAALAAVAVGLIASTWFGRPRGLLPLGIGLALAVAVTAVPARAAGLPPIAAEHWSYDSVAQLPAARTKDFGSLTIDLTGLAVDTQRQTTFHLEAGTARLVLPRAANVDVRVRVEAGRVLLPTRSVTGLDLQESYSWHPRPGAPVLTVDLLVDAGEVVVEP